MIWCNYGFSFLNGNEANIFLEKAKKSLKGDGILMIKDVIAEEENCAAVHFKEEERVFRSLHQYIKVFQKKFHIKEYFEF